MHKNHSDQTVDYYKYYFSGLKLTSVCEFIRHQAASIDELRAEIAFPEYMLGYNSIYKVLLHRGRKKSLYSQRARKIKVQAKKTGEIK